MLLILSRSFVTFYSQICHTFWKSPHTVERGFFARSTIRNVNTLQSYVFLETVKIWIIFVLSIQAAIQKSLSILLVVYIQIVSFLSARLLLFTDKAISILGGNL